MPVTARREGEQQRGCDRLDECLHGVLAMKSPQGADRFGSDTILKCSRAAMDAPAAQYFGQASMRPALRSRAQARTLSSWPRPTPFGSAAFPVRAAPRFFGRWPAVALRPAAAPPAVMKGNVSSM